MKYYFLILIAFVLSSCDVSTQSNNKTLSLTNLKATINIQDRHKSKTLTSIKVKLSDGKKQIINKNIRVLLNDLPLELFVKNDLYYTKKSFYTTDSLDRKNSYYFEIILPDNTRHPLAFIKPKSIHKSTKFSTIIEPSVQKDIVFEWENLQTPHFVEITKGIQLIKENVDNVTYHEYEKRSIDTLYKKTGTYVIPKSFLIDTLSTTNFLNIDISRKETGLLNPNLNTNSTIQYEYQIKKKITFNKK